VALYFAAATQMHDFRTLQDHVAPTPPRATCCSRARCRTTSRACTPGSSRSGGRARHPAFQTNRNLKLSEGAWAESVPNLEIETNDVKCSHASTVGPIDEDQRFYLESRGVPPRVAERLIVLGFFDEVLDAAARRPTWRRSVRGAKSGAPSSRGDRHDDVTAVCALDDLDPGTARRFDVDGLRIAVVRIGDDVYAIGDTCSHADVSLSEGEVWCEERELECWKHGSTFSLETGEPHHPAGHPAGARLRRRSSTGDDVLVVIRHEHPGDPGLRAAVAGKEILRASTSRCRPARSTP
jgi:nitrite reductase/ring-hydroxylating ferredoxin subunit